MWYPNSPGPILHLFYLFIVWDTEKVAIFNIFQLTVAFIKEVQLARTPDLGDLHMGTITLGTDYDFLRSLKQYLLLSDCDERIWKTSYNLWEYIYFSPFRVAGFGGGGNMTILSSVSCYATGVNFYQQEHW